MWRAVATDLVTAQIEAVAGDIGADAVKIGMLATAAIVEAVAAAIAELDLPHVVVDPVMVAKGGDRLLDEDAVAAMRTELLPLRARRDAERARGRGAGRAARSARSRTCARPASGSSSSARASYSSRAATSRGPSRSTSPARRTGRSSCAAAHRHQAHARHRLHAVVGDRRQPGARAATTATALARAREYLEGAIRHAPGLGRGHGPLNHFWRLY